MSAKNQTYAIRGYNTFPLEMEPAPFSEMLTSVYLLTRRHIPKNREIWTVLSWCCLYTGRIRLSILGMRPPNKNCHMLLTFYRLYLLIQKRSREHLNVLSFFFLVVILINLVTLALQKVKVP